MYLYVVLNARMYVYASTWHGYEKPLIGLRPSFYRRQGYFTKLTEKYLHTISLKPT